VASVQPVALVATGLGLTLTTHTSLGAQGQ
jgi:hypothetical protein